MDLKTMCAAGLRRISLLVGSEGIGGGGLGEARMWMRTKWDVRRVRKEKF